MSTIDAALAAEMNRAPMRLKHRPISFVWRGDEYDYHRLEDGPSLACLDRYCEAEQSWLLHSGRVILPTGAEVRDIIRQVHSISLADGPGQAAPIPQEPPEPKIVERVVEVPVDNPADKARIAELEEKLNSAVSELGRISEDLSAKNAEPPPTPLPPNPEYEEEEPMREIDIRGIKYKFTAIDALTLMGAFIVNLARDPAEVRLASGESVTVTIDDVEHIGRQLAGKEP